MQLWLMKIHTQYWQIMPIGQSKAMWQCEWHNLTVNFGTKQWKGRQVTQPCGQFLEPMQVTLSDGQILSQVAFQLVVKFGTNASGATWWSNLEIVQVAQHLGYILNQCKQRHLVARLVTNVSGANWWLSLESHLVAPLHGKSWKDNSSYKLYTLGPLCLWQCLFIL